jgi:hypothetical protein
MSGYKSFSHWGLFPVREIRNPAWAWPTGYQFLDFGTTKPKAGPAHYQTLNFGRLD